MVEGECKITRITFAVSKERLGGLVTAVMFVLKPAESRRLREVPWGQRG